MKACLNKVILHDYCFARIMNASYEEDITEWFSDHDIYLPDVIRDRELAAQAGVEPFAVRSHFG